MSLGIIAQSEGVFDMLPSNGLGRDNVSTFEKFGQSTDVIRAWLLHYWGTPGECGAGWNEAVQIFDMPFMSNALDHPNISGLKAFASSGLAQVTKDTSLTMIWNPDNSRLEW